MALDILIVGLILLSLGINILALGAFWITPSLRTLSNRFTINLLCINTLGSIILLHNLLISNNMELKVTLNQNYFADLNFGIYQQYEAMIHQDNVMLNNSLPFNEYNKQIKNIDKLLKLNETISERYFKNWMNENLDIINWNDVPVYIQHWSLDVCAALGSLAFLLIVSNIWCAITDPLRYKGRITGDRVSKCIAFTWILSAIIAVVSYFTATPFKYNLFRDYIYTNFNLELFTFNIDLSKIYTVTYFFSISLLPFIFISYMCWKVSYEARNNDLRIRKTSATLPVRRGSNSNIAKYQHKVGPPHIHSSFINKNFILNCTLKHKINKKEVVSKRYVNIRRISTRKLRGSIRCKQNVNVKSNKHHDNQNKYSLIRISNASLYKIKKKSQITKLRSPSNIQKLKRLIPCLYEKRLPVAIHLQNMQLKSQFTNCTYFPNLKQVKPLNKSEKLLITKGFVFSPSSNHRFRNNYLPLKCCKASRSSIISILAVFIFFSSFFLYGCFLVLQNLIHIDICHIRLFCKLQILFVLFGHISSPLIFAYRTKRVRSSINKILKFHYLYHGKSLKYNFNYSSKNTEYLKFAKKLYTKCYYFHKKHSSTSSPKARRNSYQFLSKFP